MTSPSLRLLLAGSLSILALTATGPAKAHHSFAMFDRTRSNSVEGVVKEFEWTNPHSWLRVVVTGPDNKEEVWAFEIGGGPTTLGRRGWKRSSFKPGDRVKVTLHPLRQGGNGGQFVQAITADGQTLQ